MNTTITVRHTEVDDAVKARAGDLLEKLAKRAPRIIDATVIFDEEHNEKIVEIKIHLPQGQIKVARAEGPDPQTALDRCYDKMQHQLDRGTSSAVR